MAKRRNKQQLKDEGVGSSEPNKKEESSTDSDDDLPCALSPAKKLQCTSKQEFQEGDLVFAKFKKFPYWPALFSKYCHMKRKTCYVYFFETSTLGTKKTLRVPATSIKHYSCPEKEKYILLGKAQYESEYQAGLDRALDYVQKRAMDKVPDFFNDFEEEEEEDDEEEEEENDVEPLTMVREKKETKECAKQSVFSLMLESELRKRTSKRRSTAQSKLYTEWISKNGREYLNSISKGEICSQRHHIFFHGSQKEKDDLKYLSGYGPISCDEEVDKLVEQLIQWHDEDFPNRSSYNTVAYVTEVWQPEVIIASIKHQKGLTLEEAEKIFSD